MSIDVMTQVWKYSKSYGSDLLIMLAIADHADDYGKAYPSVNTLAQKGRMSERNVQYCLRHLEALGELKVLKSAGPHGTHLFQIAIDGANFAPVKTLHPKRKSRRNKGLTLEEGANISGVQSLRGERAFAGGVQPVAPESSVEPSVKEEPPEKANAFSCPQGTDENEHEPTWGREWPKAKRFPKDFPREPPTWFLDYCAGTTPHVDVAHEWGYMLDQTFKSLRTQFFMVARRWMENEEEKRQGNGARASPPSRGSRSEPSASEQAWLARREARKSAEGSP